MPKAAKAIGSKLGEIINEQEWLKPVVEPIKKLAKLTPPKPAENVETPIEEPVEIAPEAEQQVEEE